MGELDTALLGLITQHPRFQPCVEVDQPLSFAELISPETLARADVECANIFHIEQAKHRLQLWFYTLLGDILNPSIYLIVNDNIVPLLDLEQGLFSRDPKGYWFGYRPHTTASLAQSGAVFGQNIAKLIDAICTYTDIRPAPLWAVVADGIVQPALAAGNYDFEQLRAIEIAQQLSQAVATGAGVRLPAARIEQISDGEMIAYQPEVEPDFVVSHRVSCCMIYHSPDIGKCTSCPHKPREDRIKDLIAASEMM
ncbi:Uncharacterized Fe-S protein [Corynebacterium kutscheri]|uniref:(2Fe-2S)-binding protein n=1 Tax=Corynebacterium kutscheri TaxID=35755 RepID=UPI000F715552|nr:(2Fe-2S)-binding protein [Corynebacterium kutscheri]VEH80095.1 Uncharacterized Fe-S protein [Corynebacterium kutscheri]